MQCLKYHLVRLVLSLSYSYYYWAVCTLLLLSPLVILLTQSHLTPSSPSP